MSESKSVDGVKELSVLLSSYETLITYDSLGDEVSCIPYLPLGVPVFTLRPDPNLDPLAEALRARTFAHERTTAVLLPGRRFDALGTRHGRGGGWYDRFLAEVPLTWTRIGLCTEKEFSKERLVRESWDQPVDFVWVRSEDGTSTIIIPNDSRTRS